MKKSLEISFVASKMKKKNIEDFQFWLKSMIAKANRPWRCDEERVVEMGERWRTDQSKLPSRGEGGGGYLGEIVISVCTILAGCEICGNLS